MQNSTFPDASRGQGNLEEMEIKRKDLQARHVDIQQRLQAIQSQIQSINSSCPTCNVPDASNLETAADYSQVWLYLRGITKYLLHTLGCPDLFLYFFSRFQVRNDSLISWMKSLVY